MAGLVSFNDNRTLRSKLQPRAIGAENAHAMAVEALSHIAADPQLFERFLGVTGLDVASIRQAAATPGFLPGVLDFLLAHEPSLLAFAREADIDPSAVAAARSALGGAHETAAFEP